MILGSELGMGGQEARKLGVYKISANIKTFFGFPDDSVLTQE